MKIISFNVNGIRAIVAKNFIQDMKAISPDVICLQETKADAEQVDTAVAELSEYQVYANAAEKKGYSGTAILSKKAPISVEYGMGTDEHDHEGRIVKAEFDDFFLVCVYVPNSGSELARLPYRQQWDADFLAYLKKCEKTKPVIICGDLNVAHQAIDLARPKENYNKAAGYMQEEIDGLNRFVEAGLVDTFRNANPEQVKYSWWSYRAGAREKNVGWRIDYFLVSQSFLNRISATEIYNDILGSDHCPVGITIK
ncbi:MAG: exodeoxyribonuclease III [Crocinitomicaceae bacterium]|nr:exodeoxyribonuclease III [Crocinitomicaceae bacterium]